MSIWLVGSGYMAQEYAKVLVDIAADFKVIGRGKNSAKSFENQTKITVVQGGINNALISMQIPELAIVAVGVEELANTALNLLESGVKRILLEKPGGINKEEITAIQSSAMKNKASVLLAYNRRFYASVEEAEKLIKQDGGIRTCNFEFTEWSHTIAPLKKGPGVKESWFLSNSSHVVDLAFYLCGFPKEIHSINKGSLDWHPSSSRFSGSGLTSKNVLFSYFADWSSAGRWGIELTTKKRRIVLRPLEEIKTINIGSIEEKKLEISNTIDTNFKPGIFRMVQSFVENKDDRFLTIGDQLSHMDLYNQMAGY